MPDIRVFKLSKDSKCSFHHECQTYKTPINDTMNKQIMFRFRKNGCVPNIMTTWNTYKDKTKLKHEATRSLIT